MRVVYPSLSIIIPTRSSERFLNKCLSSITNQDYPKNSFEVLVVDNQSSDNTRMLAQKMGAKIIPVSGNPPMVCQQRNLGAKKSRGEYLFILDHDMELPKGFFHEFARMVNETGGDIGAWYIPEEIKASTPILSKVRTLEEKFYENTVITAVRIFKRDVFFATGGYDESLSSGPADWDMDLLVRLSGVKRETLNLKLYHHEKNLRFWDYILKKGNYADGIGIYKKKWQKKNHIMYNSVVTKQFSFSYRYLTVFIDQGKWYRLLLPNLHLVLILIVIKLLHGMVYILKKTLR